MMRRTQRIDTYDARGNVVTREVEWFTTPEEDNAEALTVEAGEAIARLQAIVNTQGNFSTSAVSNAARVIARALIVLLRLHLQRLDSTT